MKKKRGLHRKEKIEIAIVIGSVLFVAALGLILTQISPSGETLAGQAVHLSSTTPTYEGTLLLLKQQCVPQQGSGSCDTICGQNTCIPLEENCDVELEANSCLCCSLN